RAAHGRADRWIGAAADRRRGARPLIRSMTGFSDASAEMNGTHFAVEIRSLNNKFFKALIRLPDEIQGLEAEIDSLLRQRLTRGSVTATVRYFDPTATAAYEINVAALQKYVDRLGE